MVRLGVRFFGSTRESLSLRTDMQVAEQGADGILEYLISFTSAVLSRFVDEQECVAAASTLLEVGSWCATSSDVGLCWLGT